MEVTWFGHSCFLLKDSDGTRLLTDPFDASLGYTSPNEAVDIVTVSHHHFDHNHTNTLPGIPTVVDKSGVYNLGRIRIEGIDSYHDRFSGAKRGNNIIFLIQIDGFTVCHMGDLGHMPSPEMFAKIGSVDLLLIPVGGNYTIDGEEASKIAKIIKSHIVIPMHYGTEALSFPLEGVEKFIIKMANSNKVNDSTLTINGDLTEYNTIKILDYKF